MLAKTIADPLTCVEVKAPVKTEGDIDAGLEAYTDVDTINEFEALALVYRHVFLNAGQKYFRHTETLPEVELETLADLMTEAGPHAGD